MQSSDLEYGPVFEIRTYDFNIKGLSEYLRLMPQGFWKTRASFSSVMGPWKTELGGLCQIVYIAQYDSLTQLLDTRRKMLHNAEWTQYVMRISDVQMSLHNVLTVLAPGTHLDTNFQPSEFAVYELQTMPERERDIRQNATHVEGTTVVGRFLSVYGPSKTEFCLLRYPNSKTAFTDAFKQRPTLLPGTDTRLMLPIEVSNMK